METTNVEHNFLTEKTKDYLKTLFKDKNHSDFVKRQKEKMKKSNQFFFCLPLQKQNLLDTQFNKMYEFDANKTNFNDLNNEDVTNLHYPETELIDYSEYSNEKFFKNDLFSKEYKDGILLVSNCKVNKTVGQFAFAVADCDKKNTVNGKVILSTYQSREQFKNLGQIDWQNKKFDKQLILYFVFPSFSKNKAIKIILKNDKIKSLINYFREKEPVKNSKENILFIRSKASTIDFVLNLKTKESYDEFYGDIKDKNIFLKYGYESALIRLNNIIAYFDDNELNFNLDFKKRTDGKNIEELKQIYLKEIYPYEENFGPYLIPEKHNKETQLAFYKSCFLKFILLRFACNYNSLLDKTIIDTEYKSVSDCLLFWNKINLFELFFNLFNKNNCKLALNPEEVVNDLDKSHEHFILEIEPIPQFIRPMFKETLKKSNIIDRQYVFKEKHILQEAIDSSTGYLMPYDGAFELLHDPLFNFIRFREYEDFISIVISDKNERCLVEVFDKNKVDFKYMLWNDLKQSQYHSEDCVDDIYTKLATCIRDAKVLIERDSTMQYQGKRRPYGSNTNSVYHVYFPRVKYKRSSNRQQLRKERDFFNESRKFSGTRRQHARRLVAGHKADKKQLLLAKQMDFYVPEGHTYVKPSTWGDKMTKREVRYRNTALNGIFYFDTKEMSEAQKIDRLSSAGFEEYCSKHLQKLGYEIKHRRNYDGGIDIRAVKILDNMEAEDLLVQCKHWNYPVSPGAIRDFKTACDLEESKNNKKFVFMTSSKFSPGAVELADKFGIMLVDGEQFIDKKVKL
jgi:hypothetical protein